MKHEIFLLENGAMERWRNGDPMGWAEISTEDVLYVDPGLTQPIAGIEAYTAFLQGLAGKISYQKSEFIDPRLEVVGDAAVLSYNYRSTRLDQDGSTAGQTPWNTTEVYFRQAGQWKIVHSHWSFTRQRLPRQLEIPLPVQLAPAEYPGVLGELMQLESAAMQRYDRGDPWGFIEISAPNVTYFDTGTPQRINGREALSAEYATRVGKISCDVMDFIDPQIRVCGNLAVLYYRLLSTDLNPDSSIKNRTPWNCTEVFQHSAGEWKIIHTHWSFINGERA
jgi:ketosteroid isomerase-like protein